MSRMVVIAGIDVSKDKLDIHVLPSNRPSWSAATLAAWPALLAGCARPASTRRPGSQRRLRTHRHRSLGGRRFRRPAAQPCPCSRLCRSHRHAGPDRPDRRQAYRPLLPALSRHELTCRPEQARKLGEFLDIRAMLLKLGGEICNSLEHVREPDLKALADTLSARHRGKAQGRR